MVTLGIQTALTMNFIRKQHHQWSRGHLSCPSLPAIQETWILSLGQEDPLEKEIATYSSILAWRIPWTVESMGLQRVGHD